MRVLENPNPQQTWSMTDYCTGRGNGGGGCGAKLEVTLDDVFRTHTSDYTGGGDNCVTFECCCCGTWTDMRNFPSQLIHMLNFRGGSEYRGRRSLGQEIV